MAEMRCEVCGRAYKRKSGLRRHMKAEHQQKAGM
jgi:rubredoxin